MPATQWDDCCADIYVADAEAVERAVEVAVKAREEELEERIRELQIEAYDDGHADALKECKATDAKVQAIKRERKRRMGK